MSGKRIVGIVVIVVGLVLLIMGISETNSLGEKVLQGTIGEYSSSTMLLLIVGIVLIVAGAIVMMKGRKRR